MTSSIMRQLRKVRASDFRIATCDCGCESVHINAYDAKGKCMAMIKIHPDKMDEVAKDLMIVANRQRAINEAA
jgi:hypothetical protein